MTAPIVVYVDCFLPNGETKTYEICYGQTIGISLPPTNNQFITDAKDYLHNDQIASPPYSDVTFNVRRP